MTPYEEAQATLDSVGEALKRGHEPEGSTLEIAVSMAAVSAQLAQVDAIHRLAAAIETRPWT